MYISILDYGNGTVNIIHDEKDVTKKLSEDELEGLLGIFGYEPNSIMWMTTDNNPFELVEEYVTVEALIREVDKEQLAEISKELISNE